MLLDVVVGAVLIAGIGSCVAAAFLGRQRLVWLLAAAARTLPIGTAYAVWVGIGATGAAVLGIVLFREPISPARAAFLVLLVVSIIGLKLTAQTAPP